MKLSNLSIAIFAAISLAACGGSSNNDQTTPEKQAPKPETPVVIPETETPGEVSQEIVDPSQTGVVGKLNFKKEPSQGTLQYIRDEKSLFDRLANKDESTSATSILGVDADSQNPKFTNIVRARLLKDGKIKVIQYLGQPREDADNINGDQSLQTQNNLNVNLLDQTKATGSSAADIPVTETDLTTLIGNLDDQITELKAVTNKSIEQKEILKEAEAYKKVLKDLEKKIKDDPNYGLGLVSLRFDNNWLGQQNVFGDLVPTSEEAMEKVKSGAAEGPEAIGLVGVNYPGLKDSKESYDATNNPVEKKTFQGLEENSRSSTRIFGRYYNTDAQSTPDYYNSYKGATTFVAGTNVGKVSTSGQNATEKLQASTLKAVANLAAVPQTLELVQYGRVTGNLDPIADYEETSEVQYVRAPFLRKGDEKAVDTYFYRGADATTVEEMEKLAKDLGDRKVVYNGHALMYGIDNSYHGGKGKQDVPTAIGVGAGSHALGNFVTATVDLANANVKGNIYNVWKKNDSLTSVTDTLVEFEGNIHGNTVLGEATRIYDKSDKADLRASFFGEKAAELGGSINSTTWQEKFGAKGDVWGGVFGAKRDADPVKGLDNLDVGDVSNLD
ncbi:transferrin-binding protein-like solute binding protein [Cardiobacteriaceae bacterium TAE3-ERU3]|nr:transferrin-binding protein-like solute binding protein [Cardiobacteriaceae bacterium TAE3-ERU3]